MEAKKKKSDFWDKLKVPYRLNIMNNETFEEIGSYKLTLLNLYIAFCTILFIGAALVLLLFFFSPIKKWLPGYQDISANTEFLIMEKKLQTVEKEFEQYKIYTDKLGQLIHGVPADKKDMEGNEIVNRSVSQVKEDNIVPEEKDLRTKMENQDILTILTEDLKTNIVNNRPIAHIYFIPPVSGEISAGFMIDKNHYGVDVLAPKNTAVKAVMDGYVISSDWTLETGNTIGIQHDNKMISFYKHNSQLLKSTGDPVRAGEAVAIIGNSGTLSDGPHLHFELWYDGKPLNPEDYIKF